MRLHKAFICVFSCLAVLPVQAQEEQDLTLFEETEEPEEERDERRRPERRQRDTEPAFTLRGTSRFGDEYNTSLVSRDGQAVSVNWKPATRAQVGAYAGFSIVDVNSRSVSLEIPAAESCIESTAKGVSCSSDGRTAILSLSIAEPIAPPRPAVEPGGEIAEGRVAQTENGDVIFLDESEDEPLPLNPFSGEPQVAPEISEEERLARAERQETRMRALQNFQPVRIPDEDVPPGMRKISTPFGDRLVQDDQR